MYRILKLAMACILPFRSRGAQTRSSDPVITQVSVLATGQILLDGKEATLSRVSQALERTRAGQGAVWYYREPGSVEPPREAIEVFKLLVESKLPISLSTKADFSDYIDEQGRSQPRK